MAPEIDVIRWLAAVTLLAGLLYAFYFLIKKLASVLQLFIPKDSSVNFFATSTKCNLFFFNKV